MPKAYKLPFRNRRKLQQIIRQRQKLLLQQAIQIARKSQKSVNDETYAQKTAKLEKTLGEMNEFIDKVNNPEDDKQDNGKKGEEE